MPLTAMAQEGSPAGPGRPRALIVSVYGAFARESGGWLSVSSLIRLMAELGVDEPAVRSSISRLKRRGVLSALRHDGSAGYVLSDQASTMLEDGDRRIFERPRAELADGWVLVVFSVPESERQQRHVLRSRLTWLGFGTVSAGVWIAPRHLEAETREVLERLGLASYVDLFGSDYLDGDDLHQQVADWWDLEGLRSLYVEFEEAHQPVLRTWRRRSRSDSDAFADYVRVLTAWRRLPFLDPGLPEELLPPRWPGSSAADLFADLRQRLDEPARAFVHATTAPVASRP